MARKQITLLTRDDLRSRGIIFAKSHLRRLWSRGDFPAPIRLSERKLVWDKRAIDKWIARRADAQRSERPT